MASALLIGVGAMLAVCLYLVAVVAAAVAAVRLVLWAGAWALYGAVRAAYLLEARFRASASSSSTSTAKR